MVVGRRRSERQRKGSRRILVRFGSRNWDSARMRIVIFNATGIRSAANKGFLDWLKTQKADVVCLQETKSQENQLTDPMFRPDGHHCFYRDAVTKKGFSGVAIFARKEPDEVLTK